MSRSKTDKNPQWRSTKIVATLGPSSNSLKIIKDLIRSGVNVFRLNMSHGSHDEHLGLASDIRKASKELGTLVAILVDLCGPKIRIGRLKHDQVFLKENNDVDICCKNVIGDSKLLPCQYRNLYKDVKKGHRIFIDDGKIELVVKSVKDKMVRCKIVNGGVLRNNKGINLPDTDVSISGITKKDRQDVEIAKKIEADFIALSFVKDKSDIKKLKKFLADNDCEIAVIAKIERREAVYNIDEIINESYGIMIARGDLGIELPAQEVPIIQKKIVASCQQAGKPAIVATQMLESMIYSSQPTRAEVGDVANAALSSVDAVMLSAETASGDYPVKAVTMMDSILREMESYQLKQKCFGEQKNAASEAGISTERKPFHMRLLLWREILI